MTRLDRLVREAKRAMLGRGHSVNRAHRFPRGTRAVVRCHRCPAQAVADAAPPPNGVDLGGDGLAVQCRPADYDLAGTDYQRTAAYLDSPGGIFIRRT